VFFTPEITGKVVGRSVGSVGYITFHNT